MKHVAENVKALRELTGLNQEEFGKKFGATRGQIGSYEEGRAVPKTQIATALCEHFGITTDQLLKKKLSSDVLDKISRGQVAEEKTPYIKTPRAEEPVLKDKLIECLKETNKLKDELLQAKDEIINILRDGRGGNVRPSKAS